MAAAKIEPWIICACVLAIGVLAVVDLREQVRVLLKGLLLSEVFGPELTEKGSRYFGSKFQIQLWYVVWPLVVLALLGALTGLFLMSPFGPWVLPKFLDSIRESNWPARPAACIAVGAIALFLVFRLPSSRGRVLLPLRAKGPRAVARVYRDGVEAFARRLVLRGNSDLFLADVAHHLFEVLVQPISRQSRGAAGRGERAKKDLVQHLTRLGRLTPRRTQVHLAIFEYLKKEGVTKTRRELEAFLADRGFRAEFRVATSATARPRSQVSGEVVQIETTGIRGWSKAVSYGVSHASVAGFSLGDKFVLEGLPGEPSTRSTMLVLKAGESGRRYLAPV